MRCGGRSPKYDWRGSARLVIEENASKVAEAFKHVLTSKQVIVSKMISKALD